MPRLLRRFDVAVGAFVVQVCIKVVSYWLLGEMAWANLLKRVLVWWMVAETDVSPKLIIPTKSPDSGWISQHSIILYGSRMKNLLGHIEERLGHVGEVSDLLKTICILPMLQYQPQVNQMRDAKHWQLLNTVLVQSDDDGVAKDTVVEIQRRDDDNGVVPVIMVKKGVSTKKIIGHLNFNICPFWDSIVSDNLV